MIKWIKSLFKKRIDIPHINNDIIESYRFVKINSKNDDDDYEYFTEFAFDQEQIIRAKKEPAPFGPTRGHQ